MKHPVTKFKSLTEALKQLAPFIQDPKQLLSGKPFEKFGQMRPREAVANWLICAAFNEQAENERLTFTSDPLEGDGILYDQETKETFPTEHITVPPSKEKNAAGAAVMILNAINAKRDKGGKAYASGKILVVFLQAAGGEWFPNRVAKSLPEPLFFSQVWVVGFQQAPPGEFVFSVVLLEMTSGNAPAWLVRIGKDFDKWDVKIVQA